MGPELPKSWQHRDKRKGWQKYSVRSPAGQLFAHLRNLSLSICRAPRNELGVTRTEYKWQPSLLALCGALRCPFSGLLFVRLGPLFVNLGPLSACSGPFFAPLGPLFARSRHLFAWLRGPSLPTKKKFCTWSFKRALNSHISGQRLMPWFRKCQNTIVKQSLLIRQSIPLVILKVRTFT